MNWLAFSCVLSAILGLAALIAGALNLDDGENASGGLLVLVGAGFIALSFGLMG